MSLFKKLIRFKCCRFLSLKTGCIIISFYTLFFGFINAGTIVDDAIFKQTKKTDKSIKWFNVCHIAMMIAAAVVLLIAVMAKLMEFVILWMTMFIIHIISYYIVFHALSYSRNPYFRSAISIFVYVLLMLISLVIDLYCILIVYLHYYVTKNPNEFRPPCVNK